MSDALYISVSPAESIQSILDTLPAGPVPVILHLSAGIYREKLVVSRPYTTLEGEGAENTRIIWQDGAFEKMPDGEKRGTFRTATLRTDCEHITLRRLTIENSASPREKAGQAIALYADGDHFLCEDVRLIGAQDTLFAAPLPEYELEKNGFRGPKQFSPRLRQRHLYRRCTVVGDIDFVFGGAAAWFESCRLISIDGREDCSTDYVGFVTAGSTPQGQAFGFVFDHCIFSGEGIPDGSVYLGRPWRDHAAVTLLHCELGPHIHPAGFHDWNKIGVGSTVRFLEYGSRGSGASGSRAAFVKELSSAEADAITLEAFMKTEP